MTKAKQKELIKYLQSFIDIVEAPFGICINCDKCVFNHDRFPCKRWYKLYNSLLENPAYGGRYYTMIQLEEDINQFISLTMAMIIYLEQL